MKVVVSSMFLLFLSQQCNDFTLFSSRLALGEDNMAAITTDGANMMDGTKVLEAGGQSKMGGGARKKNRSRSASASSVDSVSSGSYTGMQSAELVKVSYLKLINLFQGSSSEDDDESPRELNQKNSAGSADFCVKKISQHSYGRREIEVRELSSNVLELK